jgi:hypothetical protein
MRIIVSTVLIAVSFLAGWQLEHHKRRGRLANLGPYKWCAPRLAISDGSDVGTQVDILVRDRAGKWRTLAFAATVNFNDAKVHEKDEAVVARISEQVRLRPTIHPGSTYACSDCAKCEVHDELCSSSDFVFASRWYECRQCRGRIERVYGSTRCVFTGDMQREERYFPTAPLQVISQ